MSVRDHRQAAAGRLHRGHGHRGGSEELNGHKILPLSPDERQVPAWYPRRRTRTHPSSSRSSQHQPRSQVHGRRRCPRWRRSSVRHGGGQEWGSAEDPLVERAEFRTGGDPELHPGNPQVRGQLAPVRPPAPCPPRVRGRPAEAAYRVLVLMTTTAGEGTAVSARESSSWSQNNPRGRRDDTDSTACPAGTEGHPPQLRGRRTPHPSASHARDQLWRVRGRRRRARRGGRTRRTTPGGDDWTARRVSVCG